jgi:hypothetical protein
MFNLLHKTGDRFHVKAVAVVLGTRAASSLRSGSDSTNNIQLLLYNTEK